MSLEPQLTRSGYLPETGLMSEKLAIFVFAGILGAMLYHFTAAALLHRMLMYSSDAFDWWLVPLAVVPAILLLGLAWALGFGRRGSTLWGNLAVLACTAGIVFFTLGAPYNCWKEFCF